MESSGSDEQVSYSCGAEEKDYDLGHLPPLLEDEENVSLADILSLRDSCLSEEEVWAVCAECIQALQSIRPSHLFHTLCITPDTLAFNAHGNVCFMEQLSDDPEGSFVPPEFDSTGSTFEGHVFSLGSTLSAALSFVAEPELGVELGEEIQKLLEQMQEKKPEDRPLLQDILCVAQSRLSATSSAAVCRRLSSVGRRVLSIESVSTFQDGLKGSWEARWQHPNPRCPLSRLSSEDNSKDLHLYSAFTGNGLSRQQVCRGWDLSLWAEDLESNDGDIMILADDFDCRSYNSSPVKKRPQQRLNRVRGALNRSCSVPDSNNPPCFLPPTHGDISEPVSNLTEIGAEAPLWGDRPYRLNRGKSCESYPHRGSEDNQMEKSEIFFCGEECEVQGNRTSQDSTCSTVSCQEVEQGSPIHHNIPNNHMTKSMLCLNEESQDEWISLRELLSRSGRRLTVNELWALCYTCMSSLQTYIDYPAHFCLDTVHVGCEGEVLFLKPKNRGSHNEFDLAPEYQEHGIVTEKVCVYGIATILWAAAKFSLLPHQKLAMPRKLKRLLLEMARRTPIERPTIVMAKKRCHDYLSCQGTNAETVWQNLISRVHPPANSNADHLTSGETHQCACTELEENSGFVPMATESRLAPVPGPVPHSYSSSGEVHLPEAFTSTATHFTPIILTSKVDSEESSQNLGTAVEGILDYLTKGCEDVADIGSHFASNCDYPDTLHTDDSLKHVSQGNNSPASCNVTIDYSPSTPSDFLLLQQLPTSFNKSAVFNNFLFHHDPRTGHISLLPVQLRAPQSLLGLDVNLSMVKQHFQRLVTAPCNPHDSHTNGLKVPERPKAQDYPSPSSSVSDSHMERDAFTLCSVKTGNRPPTEAASLEVHPALKEVIDLLKGKFLLESSWEKEYEDIAMGEFIFSLKELQYQTFASVVKERFADLYWEDDLLGVLHCLVNYRPTALVASVQPSSKATKSAASVHPSAKTLFKKAEDREDEEEGTGPLGRCLDLNGNVPMLADAAGGSPESNEAPSAPAFQNASGPVGFELRSQENQQLISQGASGNSRDTGVMEVEEPPAGLSVESPSNAAFPPASFGPGDPDCAEGVEESDLAVTERTLLPGSQTPALGLGCSSGWALSFFGEDCFSQEVVEYAGSLGQHTGSAGLEVKTQELQQQLVIETRNLKKTRNFYQKLIQQERKNKGSECKPMLIKLKSQFEELKSKVVFLDWVKKYLEILSVEQWGLEASLLPSLVICGAGCLDLRSSQDPSVLCFSSSKGKSVLQAGSVQGLMAYLYARNVAVEGYIHQFLYTYRFLCTPEQLLQFIMEKFISAARQGPTMTGDSEKVFHRSLDILYLWIRDCKQVDFTPESKLVDTLEQFLNAEVIPRDGRGETLLDALRHPPSVSWSQSRESLLVSEEEEDSSVMSSSTDDLSRKWRFPKAVESKEKAFSIAAVLPVPCYNLSDASEEWVPFSKNEHSAQHIAQQLTLLEQQAFQGCHPVHFLKSRIKGIGGNAFSQNKIASQQVQPAEGSSLLVCDAAQSEGCLQKLLDYADSVSNWISAEIVMCDSVKTQVALLTKYLWIGKHCYESRNFATAMQVLSAMESVIVRQLPTWKHLSSKVCEILEELRAVQVFLKSDDLCLMKGEHTSPRLTLPSAHILAMHIQQLEIGAFTLTNGAYKWTKLRSIAKVVSQVHAFQGVTYPYSPDRELQDYLRRRIAWLAASDKQLTVTDAGLQQSSERQSRKIQEKLKRVKASFQ